MSNRIAPDIQASAQRREERALAARDEAGTWLVSADTFGDEPEEDDGPFCSCDLEATINELEDGRCDCCGRALA